MFLISNCVKIIEIWAECSKIYIEQENRIAVGRFLTGMGLGMTLTIPNVYIVEVTDPQYRGVLGVLPNLFCQLGIFVTYVIGQWLDWSQLAFACTSFLFFSNFSGMFLNSNYFFPIWILLVLMHLIWETSRNKLKKHSVS